MIHKPLILYFDKGQKEKRSLVTQSAQKLGIDVHFVEPEHALQTMGYLAKIKGFPPRKISLLEQMPSFNEEVIIFCHFPNEMLDTLLHGMKAGSFPSVELKAVLTSSNCFWTFSQLFQELAEEHSRFTKP